MKDLVLKAISEFSLLQKGDTVTVALSGGADSVALLHSLLSLKEELGITVNAAHLNHLIRGQEALRDQKFVEELCEKSGVLLFCEQIDVPQYAKDNHLSLELAARQVRYDFLERVAVGKIATAHTASDNLETVLFNLSRGTALKGLCGIPAVRGNIVRPLIFASRQDVEKYCTDNQLQFVTDSTNLSDDYSRNKIRHKVIPVLKELNPAITNAVMRSCVSLSEDEAFLEKNAQETLFKNLSDNALNIDFIDVNAAAISKRVIKQYFNVCYPQISLECRHINDVYSICLNKAGKVNLPENIFAICENNQLKFTEDICISKPQFAVEICDCENVNNLFSNNLIDCDKIVGKLVIRTRQEGDKLRLYGRGCTKTLKKLFTENKIEVYLRDSLPVIADDNGVVWVHTVGVAQRVAISSKTKKAFEIKVFDLMGEV